MKTNLDLKTKFTLVIAFIVFSLSSCKTVDYYINIVEDVKNNKVLMKEPENGERRLVDCSKKSSTYPTLLKDLPHFRKGDTIKFKPAEGYTYDGFRAYFIEGSQFDYNHDSIQIRKDRELITKFLNDSVKSQIR